MNQAHHGGTHPEEDTDRLQREADAGHEGAREALYDLHLARRADELRAEIASLTVYLAELRRPTYRWGELDYDRYADYLLELKEELASIDEQYHG